MRCTKLKLPFISLLFVSRLRKRPYRELQALETYQQQGFNRIPSLWRAVRVKLLRPALYLHTFISKCP